MSAFAKLLLAKMFFAYLILSSSTVMATATAMSNVRVSTGVVNHSDRYDLPMADRNGSPDATQCPEHFFDQGYISQESGGYEDYQYHNTYATNQNGLYVATYCASVSYSGSWMIVNRSGEQCSYASSGTYDYGCAIQPQNTAIGIEAGSLEAEYSDNTRTRTGESTYSLYLACDGRAQTMTVTATFSLLSLGVSASDALMLNGVSQSLVEYAYISQESAEIWRWFGKATWVIPLNVPCGQTIDLIPSASSGYASGVIDSIRISAIAECKDGEIKQCYTGPAGKEGVGECLSGTSKCINKAWSPICDDEVLPVQEKCDEKDNDCDGEVDNGFECKSGEAKPCYTGSAETEDVGICHGGTTVCKDCKWDEECTGEVLPEAVEKCDGKDNNCNDDTDEGCDECVDESGEDEEGE